VVCDLSRPANLSREVAQLRPDVLVIEGGVIAVPGLPKLGRFGLGQGNVFACMAETMLLTLAGHFEDTSLGTDLSAETLRMLRMLADKHGFRVAQLRSFGSALKDADWDKLIAARRRSLAA
jgi:predicted amino acid dehydrogenase